ncbi:CAP domain-containing protein [Streptomyces sp. NPDC086787]|uniref:CAP domain-containing protein n=1 Tax=Streptomyces sp. NPDC086787 TaxID=3365759 RepID=UPI00382FC593
MGRHRRSAGRADAAHDSRASYAAPPAPMGIAPYLNPEAYAKANAHTHGSAYPPVTETAAFPATGFSPAGGGHRRRGRKAATPVRTGLLGVSAAVALGTVAVAAGAVPGLDNYRFGGGTGGGSGQVQAADGTGNAAAEQGGTSGSTDGGRADGSADSSTSRGSGRSVPPASSAPAAPAPTPTPSTAPPAEPSAPAVVPSQRTPEPTGQASKPPARAAIPAPISAQAAAQAEVLKLVNQERSKVGCDALSASGSLTGLARAFSDDMAARDFFDHTDPDGASPWDRAEDAGISGLGGENIARGQTDADSVMDAWMNSPGHRANILNCDFKTLGVGVHLGSGGPWWTQDFGY